MSSRVSAFGYRFGVVFFWILIEFIEFGDEGGVVVVGGCNVAGASVREMGGAGA